jgi:transposase InsO family protein
MKQHKDKRPIAKMAKQFGVSRSGYYAWEGRGPSKNALESQALAELIREIFKQNFSRYGSPRVWAELRGNGIRVGRKRVERLMRGHNLRAKMPRGWVKTTDSRHSLPVAENLLNRDFTAACPGEKWVSDITYLRANGGFLYLTIIIDLWDRKVIGWNIAGNLRSENLCKALRMAALNRPPREWLIFHSDRGIQYCSDKFRRALKKACPSPRQSMSRKGNCWDNACAESFFKTLKWELDILGGKHSKKEVEVGVFEYIEVYYNRRRRHSALGYAIPLAFTINYAA